ncbi:MAG: hypothetical protein ACI952_001078, partial [Flavobacteriales bacterium]
TENSGAISASLYGLGSNAKLSSAKPTPASV